MPDRAHDPRRGQHLDSPISKWRCVELPALDLRRLVDDRKDLGAGVQQVLGDEQA